MSYYDDEMTDRAVEAYFRRVKRIEGSDVGIRQPSRHDTHRDGDTIVIANGHGELARYHVRSDGRLRWKKPHNSTD